MATFRESFKIAEKRVRPRLSGIGFALHSISFDAETDSSPAFGSARYGEFIAKFQHKPARRYVCLSSAPRRLELDLDFGIDDARYGLEELIELSGGEPLAPRRHDLCSAMHDGAQLGAEFERLVGAFIGCAQRFIDEDAALWDELSAQRARQAADRDRSSRLHQAAGAFDQQEWRQVVELLTPIAADLNQLNRARLAWARKHIGGS